MSGGPLPGLEGIRVLDLSDDLGGAYCTKLLSDAGADVTKAEPPAGHALRRWSASGAVGTDGEEDGVLFRFLAAGHHSVVVDQDTPDGRRSLHELLATCDIVVQTPPAGSGTCGISPADLAGHDPRIIVVSLTPFGLEGPRSGEHRSEFLLQALAGALHNHGSADREPLAVGGALAQWAAGAYGAVGGLTALADRRRTGRGMLVDVSVLECMALTLLCYPSVALSLPGGVKRRSTYQMIPGIEPCQDGFVGLATITAEQWHTFLAMLDRPELCDDVTLLAQPSRGDRPDVVEAIQQWTGARTAAEIVEIATQFRIPSVPVGNGASLPTLEHVVARELFVTNPRGGFPQPRPPFRSNISARRPPEPAPRLGEHPPMPPGGSSVRPAPVGRTAGPEGRTAGPEGRTAGPEGREASSLPLAGVRVLDFTAFLAGPFATQYLASAGADVIKVESVQRPDPMRFSTLADPASEQWYEMGNIYLSVNLNKRGVTLNLADPRGRDLALALAAKSDVVIENFTPRVMEHFGLTFEDLRAVNPDIIMVRMPGFGLQGPWRERPGFAASMEQVSGMAWVTGYLDGVPMIPGICDPLAGAHAAFAVLAALEHRQRTGEGQQIELAMIDMAANLVSEQVLEYAAYGHLMTRRGNTSPTAAPQGAYACAEPDHWIAVSIRTDAEWQALRSVLGEPAWMSGPELDRAEGRAAAHGQIDEELTRWFAVRGQKEALAALAAAQVPAEPVVCAYDVDKDDQMNARGFWEFVTHPVVGTHRFPGWPMRYSGGPSQWFRTPAPLLGQHTNEILRDELGLSDAELTSLREANVIGTRPLGL